MKKLDPKVLKDWEIAEAAGEQMKNIKQISDELELADEEFLPYGHHIAKIDFKKVLDRLSGKQNGKYIDVTAITPTPLGEGKSTTVIGLVQGLGKLGKKVIGAIRQPSSGPTFNIKGSAAGGGLSQCLPLTDFSLGLTGDIDAITNAHNLAMVALTSRLQHEAINTDSFLAKRNLKRLNIDPRNIQMKWAIDFCAQSLRDIVIGLGGKRDGFMIESGFQITVSSEIMAILAIATGLKDFRERLSKIVVAFDKSGNPVTTADLEVDGAMAALLSKTINPNLMQTIEGQPVLVHAGPFANIAIGQSSIIADKLGLKLGDYHVTESGFGADIGFEKFWNLKCRYSSLVPDAAVVVATIRALKMHGGGPRVVPGKPLDKEYTNENCALLEKGLENLLAHIEIVKRSGTTPVVCINHFYTDTDKEINIVRKASENAGAIAALSKHWEKGGEGAVELAEAVMAACNQKQSFKLLYEDSTPIKERISLIAKEVYGADDVIYPEEVEQKLISITKNNDITKLGTCMVKTHLSLSHDPSLKGRPKGWSLPIKDILLYKGAGFIVPVAGGIKLMPGMASDAAYRKIDIDLKTGKVKGLF